MMTINSVNIVIAGGKTGGHLFPGIAVANALITQAGNIKLLFIGTDTPFETQTLNQYGFAHKSIISRPIKGGSIWNKAFSTGVVCVSLIQALIILRTFKPDFVLGVGGFSSFAVVLAAWIMRIPTAIQEQNAMPGMTNRMLSRFADTIFTAFKKTKGFENNPKVKYVGNPVRTASSDASAGLNDLAEYTPDRFTILVTGGSQGASSINTAFTDALVLLKDPGQYAIIHQTGKADESRIRSVYRKLGIKADVRAFFHAMPRIQALADLVITRAGAGTIAELSAAGAAAILVPFPHAADDHQTHNARALEANKAAIMIEDGRLTGQTLCRSMEALINDREKRLEMGNNLKSLAMPDADRTIATHILTGTGVKG